MSVRGSIRGRGFQRGGPVLDECPQLLEGFDKCAGFTQGFQPTPQLAEKVG
jgi:hypothetical protein